MLAMIRSDFIAMRGSLLQLLGICVFVAIFIWMGTGTLIAGIAAICAMIPFMYAFSVTAYDELNGWERFRLTLPISRRQVVFGRYASTLIVVLLGDVLMMLLAAIVVGVLSALPQLPFDPAFAEGYNPVRGAGFILMVSGAMVFAAACTMPLLLRFGMTKGTRFAPVIILLIIMGVLFIVGNFEEPIVMAAPVLEDIFGIGPDGAPLALGVGAGIFVSALVVYAISLLIAVKLYEKRQF